MPHHAEAPSTSSLNNAWPACKRCWRPNTRAAPRSGLTRPKSGCKAAARTSKPVCASTAAIPATHATQATGNAAQAAAAPADIEAAAGSSRNSSKGRRRNARADAAGPPVAISITVPAPSPATMTTSRLSATCPCPRASCRRLAVGASVRSSASAIQEPGNMSQDARTASLHGSIMRVASKPSSTNPPRICPGTAATCTCI